MDEAVAEQLPDVGVGEERVDHVRLFDEVDLVDEPTAVLKEGKQGQGRLRRFAEDVDRHIDDACFLGHASP